MRSKSWKRWATVLILGAAGVFSGIRSGMSAEARPAGPVRRVETITLDPSDCKLRWVVSLGEMKDGKFEATGAKENYEIDFHNAEMKRGGVTHKFSDVEAVSVHKVIVAISRYTAESVAWFEDQKKDNLRAAR